MKTFDVNIHLADYYFSVLNSLSDKAKLYLVNKLTESLINSADKTEKIKEAEKDNASINWLVYGLTIRILTE
uniref:hypothetical protein n=1 Tax=Bacteroides finegoldii TaxID=338188 RepID=UPI003568C113